MKSVKKHEGLNVGVSVKGIHVNYLNSYYIIFIDMIRIDLPKYR